MSKKRDSEYWKKRFEELERAQHDKARVCYEDVEKMYRRAQNEIEKEIAKWHCRFARNNMISLADARQMLTGRELEELRWDINEYIAHGEENAVSGAWIKQLENASARYHVSRLEALKLQTQQQMEVLFGNQLDRIDTAMKDIYTSGYYKTAFELQKGIGVGWDFASLDNKTISKVISKPWAVDGKNFSERIWNNRSRLIDEMHKTLTQNIMLGQDPQKAIKAISERMKVSKVNAGRLVMTEEAFFSSAAQKECFAELGVEQFQIVATLDSHTSQLCRDMDGKHFPMSEYKIGVTAPPFHVNCRSTTCPYFDDEFADLGERAARGADGKTYFVPANMTYREWEAQFVNGETEAEKKYGAVIKSNEKNNSDSEQFDRYRNVLGKNNVPETLEDFRKMKYNEPDTWKQMKHDYRIVNSYEDNSGHMDAKKILELDAFAFNTKTQYFTGDAKRRGNIAVMELDGEIKIANSQLKNMYDASYINFKGDKHQLVFQKDNPEFRAIEVGSHLRYMDSEAKLFEYAVDIAKDGKKHTIRMLSEKCMCDSCLGVMRQFKEKYPNVEVDVVSNKKERDAINHGKPWAHRK